MFTAITSLSAILADETGHSDTYAKCLIGTERSSVRDNIGDGDSHIYPVDFFYIYRGEPALPDRAVGPRVKLPAYKAELLKIKRLSTLSNPKSRRYPDSAVHSSDARSASDEQSCSACLPIGVRGSAGKCWEEHHFSIGWRTLDASSNWTDTSPNCQTRISPALGLLWSTLVQQENRHHQDKCQLHDQKAPPPPTRTSCSFHLQTAVHSGLTVIQTISCKCPKDTIVVDNWVRGDG